MIFLLKSIAFCSAEMQHEGSASTAKQYECRYSKGERGKKKTERKIYPFLDITSFPSPASTDAEAADATAAVDTGQGQILCNQHQQQVTASLYHQWENITWPTSSTMNHAEQDKVGLCNSLGSFQDDTPAYTSCLIDANWSERGCWEIYKICDYSNIFTKISPFLIIFTGN